MRTRLPKPDTNCPNRAKLLLPKIIFSGTDNSKFTAEIHYRDREVQRRERAGSPETPGTFPHQLSFTALPAFAAFLIRFDGAIDLSGSLDNEKGGNRVSPFRIMSSASVSLDRLFIAIELE